MMRRGRMPTSDPRLVAHVVLRLDVGGLERVVLRLLERLDRSRFTPIVVAIDGPGSLAPELGRIGVPLHLMPRRRGLDARLVFELARFFMRERVDLVHTHNPSPHLYGAAAAALAGKLDVSRAKVPVVHTKHGRNTPDAPRKVLVNRLASRLTDRVVAVGHDTSRVILDIEHVDPSRVITIPNGVDPEEFRPDRDAQAARRTLGVSPDSLVIGCVARLALEKDHASLLRAFGLVRARLPEAELVLVGDGPLRPSLEGLAASLGLSQHVRFAGARPDIAALLPAFDVFALASRTEGLSLTLIEAAATALPIVATDVGGNAEVVVHGETGLLVAPADCEALATALCTMLTSPQRSAFGARGRARVALHFSLSSMTARYEELYVELMNASPGSPVQPRPAL